MIRLAEKRDIPTLLKLADNFCSASEYAGRFSLKRTESFLSTILEGGLEKGTILVLEKNGVLHGFMIALVVPHPFLDVDTVSEIAWWVDEEHRGSILSVRLFKAFLEYARRINPEMVIVHSLGDHKVGKLYEKYGFKLVEKSYIKELG